MNDLGIRERSVGSVSILNTDGGLRIQLKFGRSTVTLTNAVESLLAAGQTKILLNLDGVRAISAKGLGELVSTHVVVRKSGGEFKLLNLTPTVRQLMSSTKLLTVFDAYENEALAIESFNHGALIEIASLA